MSSPFALSFILWFTALTNTAAIRRCDIGETCRATCPELEQLKNEIDDAPSQFIRQLMQLALDRRKCGDDSYCCPQKNNFGQCGVTFTDVASETMETQGRDSPICKNYSYLGYLTQFSTG
jgi:hypothetical protein